jgi:hypothetical protein
MGMFTITTKKPYCPKCKKEFVAEITIVSESSELLIGSIGGIMILKCSKCGEEFPYFRPVNDTKLMDKWVKLSFKNFFKKDYDLNYGVETASQMLSCFEVFKKVGDIFEKRKISQKLKKPKKSK